MSETKTGDNGGGAGDGKSFLNQANEGAKAAEGGSAGASGGASGGEENKPIYTGEDWRSKLPLELQKEEVFKPVLDVQTLAKNYLHAQKMIGKDKVVKPGEHASEDDWSSFFDQLGRPALDKYEVRAGKSEKYMDKDWLDELKPIAHKAGVMPAQLEAILNWYGDRNEKYAQDIKIQAEETKKQGFLELKKEWGQAFEQRGSFAQRLIKEHASPELIKMLDESGMGDNPQVIKLLAKIGETIYKEDKMAGMGEGGGKSYYDPGQARAKYTEIISSINHPYHKPDHPNHHAAKREVAELFQMAYPDA